MKLRSAFLLFSFTLVATLGAERTSLLDQDKDVVYMNRTVDEPIELLVIKEAPIYADKNGNRLLGHVKVDQTVVLQAMNDKAYRVSAKTGGNKVVGWVAPWAFASKDPDFVENLKKLYERELEVQALIELGEVAIGMTMDEVSQVLGTPTKTTIRVTNKGRSGTWEFIDYEEIIHYNYFNDPISGSVYKQYSHTTKEEKGKTTIEFEDDLVTAIEHTEDRGNAGRVKVVVPPIVLHW